MDLSKFLILSLLLSLLSLEAFSQEASAQQVSSQEPSAEKPSIQVPSRPPVHLGSRITIKTKQTPSAKKSARKTEVLTKPKGKKGITQLDFDIPKTKPTPIIRSPEEARLLDEMKKSVTRSDKPISPEVLERSRVPTDTGSKSVVVKFDKVSEFEDFSNYIVPRLSGLQSDPEDSSRVLSIASWKPGPRGCGDVKGAAGLIPKAVALDELLKRFTGNDNFTETHCADICQPDETTLPSSLRAQSITDTDSKLTFHMKEGVCHYRITKDPAKNWRALQASEVTCSCFVR